MTGGLFAYPPQAAFGRVIPKSKIYAFGKPSRSVRERFVAEVDQIVWRFKLSPDTINLPSRSGYEEIQVFAVAIKTEELSEAVLRCVDRAIPSPIFFELTRDSLVKTVAAYKRPSDAERGAWVVDGYFHSDWIAADATRTALPLALDLAGLYERMLRTLIDVPARDGEALADHVTRIAALRSKERECDRLEHRLQREPQFNRKVELNALLRTARQELDRLR